MDVPAPGTLIKPADTDGIYRYRGPRGIATAAVIQAAS